MQAGGGSGRQITPPPLTETGERLGASATMQAGIWRTWLGRGEVVLPARFTYRSMTVHDGSTQAVRLLQDGIESDQQGASHVLGDEDLVLHGGLYIASSLSSEVHRDRSCTKAAGSEITGCSTFVSVQDVASINPPGPKLHRSMLHTG